jgi:hypothetical protein
MSAVSDIRSCARALACLAWLAVMTAAPAAAASSAAPVPAGILGPSPGSTVSGSVTFTWTSGTSVLAIWLDVGTTVGGSQIYAGAQSGLSRVVGGLPLGGVPVHVRLWSLFDGYWSYTDYSYVTVTPVPAGMLSPNTADRINTPHATFTWTSGTAASVIWLDVGTTAGGANIYGGAQSGLSRTVTGLPVDGLPVYVRLWSLLPGGWSYLDYVYHEATPVQLLSPAGGALLNSRIVNFTWTPGSAVSVIWLDVGSTPGGSDIYAGAQPSGATSRSVDVPTNGHSLYLRLWSLAGGVWHHDDYKFKTLSQVANVREYGAAGDGITDDSAVIQKAINAANAIYFPPGQYYIGRTIQLRRSQVLYGDDRTRTWIRYDGTGDALRHDSGFRNASNGSLLTLRDLSVEGLNPANTGAGLTLLTGGFAYVQVQRVHLKGHFKYGVIFDQAEVTYLTDSIIDTGAGIPGSINAWLTNGDEHTPGLFAGFTNVLQLINNEFRGAQTGVMDDGGDNRVMENNHFIGHAIALRVAGASAVRVMNNTFETALTSGEANVLFTDRSGVPGGSVIDKGTVRGGVIEGNVFAGAVAPGGALLRFAAVTASRFHTGVSISGNHFEDAVGRTAAIDVTRLGHSFAGDNSDAAAASHYGGVHSGPYANTLHAAATVASQTPVPVTLLEPEPGSTVFGSTLRVSWTGRTSATVIWLDVGTTLGGAEMYAGPQPAGVTSRIIEGLPADRSLVYIRLWALHGGVWRHRDYSVRSGGAIASVKDFGAIGDGRADDSAAIQAALDAAPIVFLPTGTYSIRETTLRLRRGQMLFGASYSTSNIMYTGTGTAILYDNGDRNASGEGAVSLHDFYVQTENTMNTGAGIAIIAGGLAGFTVDRVYVRGPFKYGVIFDQARDSHLIGAIVATNGQQPGANVWITNGDEYTPGMSTGFSNGIVLRNNQFNAAAVGVMDDGGANHVIENNNFNGNMIPLRIAGVSSPRIVGNTFENQLVTGEANVLFTTTSGVAGGTAPDKGPSTNGTIKGNTFAGGVGPGAQSMLKFSAAAVSVFHTGFVIMGNQFQLRLGRGTAIDVTQLGLSVVGFNQDDATVAYFHYGGIHTGAYANTLLQPSRPN